MDHTVDSTVDPGSIIGLSVGPSGSLKSENS